MKKNVSIALAALLLVAAAALAAVKREGKITRIDGDAQVLSVQGEKGDQWEVYLTETTKLEDGVTLAELRVGDKIEFEYIERDGKIWATQIEREKKAER
jgi:Cu/Ag efflux protein CusF